MPDRSTPDPAALPAIIVALRDEYAARGISTYDIGNGRCDDFAREVLERWIGEDWIHRETDGTAQGGGFQTLETCNLIEVGGGDWDWPLLASFWNIRPPEGVDRAALTAVAECEPNHVWIATGGRHYDAEHPEGVETHFELMFFTRWIENAARHRKHGDH
jgi:hypothetical protein